MTKKRNHVIGPRRLPPRQATRGVKTGTKNPRYRHCVARGPESTRHAIKRCVNRSAAPEIAQSASNQSSTPRF